MPIHCLPAAARTCTARTVAAGFLTALPLWCAPARPAGPALRKTMDSTSTWEGFSRRDFTLGGRKALLVEPQRAAPGRPWIWRMEFFGHEPQADRALLERGFHLAHLDVQNLYGAPRALDAMDGFYDHLTRERGLGKRTVLEGFSRGGLFAFRWAARRPERVAAIYADAPVCDFRSWPGGRGKGPGSPADWERLKQAYGLTEAEALAYPHNPVGCDPRIG